MVCFSQISKGIDFFIDCWSAEDSNIVPSGLCILCSSLLLMYSIKLPLMINYTRHEASPPLIFNSGHTWGESSLKLQCLRPYLYRVWFYFTYFYYLFIHLFLTLWLFWRGTPAVWITVYYYKETFKDFFTALLKYTWYTICCAYLKYIIFYCSSGGA